MRRTFAEYVAIVERDLASGFSTKAARKNAKDILTIAHEIERKSVMDDLLADRALTVVLDHKLYSWNDLYNEFPYYPHQWNAKRAARYATRWPEAVAHCNRLAELVAAVKDAPEVAKTPRQPTAKELAKAAKAMTCQICGRPIFAELGRIAHHGYERPGHGWQTASCYGALHLPYEASRDALTAIIPHLEADITRQIEARDEVKAETRSIGLYARGERNRFGERASIPFHVTRETIPAALYFAPSAFEFITSFHRITADGSYTDYDGIRRTVWGEVKARDLKERMTRIKQTTDMLDHMRARHAAWKLTHDWRNNASQQFCWHKMEG